MARCGQVYWVKRPARFGSGNRRNDEFPRAQAGLMMRANHGRPEHFVATNYNK